MDDATVRKLVPFAAAVGMAFVIAFGSEVVGWGDALTYALAGITIAGLIVFGTPYAFAEPERPLAIRLDDDLRVQPEESTVSAGDYESRHSFAGDYLVISERWKQDVVLRSGPVISTTGWTGTAPSAFLQLFQEPVVVSHEAEEYLLTRSKQ